MFKLKLILTTKSTLRFVLFSKRGNENDSFPRERIELTTVAFTATRRLLHLTNICDLASNIFLYIIF